MTKPGASAYPINYGISDMDGLTKREVFAMAAMQGLIACPINVTIKSLSGRTGVSTREHGVHVVAVSLADSLIEALNTIP